MKNPNRIKETGLKPPSIPKENGNGNLAGTPCGLPPHLDTELKAFEAEERAKLGLPPADPPQWVENVFGSFDKKDQDSTIILVGGLTENHDLIMAAALRRLGFRMEVLQQSDQESLHLGKSFCNRGMCNPAYFNVGNLIRHLETLRDKKGLSADKIIQNYLFVTANGCGPCRFELYNGEYRKALRETGFEGFRVLLFNQTVDGEDDEEDNGLGINRQFVFHLYRSLMLSDILNMLKYRIRPYEKEPGATDAAVVRSREYIIAAVEGRSKIKSALQKVRREFSTIAVDPTRIKPKVAIIGEFWAQTTEGDGNYNLQRFLENEGAEVEVQPLTAWMMTMLWEARYDLLQRAKLKENHDGVNTGQDGILSTWKQVAKIKLVEFIIRRSFKYFCRIAGLHGYNLPNIDNLSRKTHTFYDINQRGGEMFMEVAKMIHYASNSKANMVVSVKPFGCMPSSGISDGVQSLIAERYPQTLFIPIETTGDSAVNVYSRLQMQLYKAKLIANKEATKGLGKFRITETELTEFLKKNPISSNNIHQGPHPYGCTAANINYRAGSKISSPFGWLKKGM